MTDDPPQRNSRLYQQNVLRHGSQNPEKSDGRINKHPRQNLVPCLDFITLQSWWSHTNLLPDPPPLVQVSDKKSEYLTWDSGRAFLYIAILRKWAEDRTPRAKPSKVNIRILINGISDNVNALRRHFQEHIKVFHPKAQVWKSNLQNFPEP